MLMLILFDQLKTPDNNTDNATSGMSTPPKKISEQLVGKETSKNPSTIVMMKVCDLLFHCYDILMVLLFW